MCEGGVSGKSQNKEFYRRASVESGELWKNPVILYFGSGLPLGTPRGVPSVGGRMLALLGSANFEAPVGHPSADCQSRGLRWRFGVFRGAIFHISKISTKYLTVTLCLQLFLAASLIYLCSKASY